MDLKEIQNLIKFVAKSGASEVKLETGDVKITIRTGSDEKETTVVQQVPMGGQVQPQMPVQQQAPAPAPQGRAGPSQGPLFRSAAHGGREPAQKCISSNVLRGDSCPSLIPPIYAS